MVIYCGGTFPLFFVDEQMVIYCGGTFPLFFFDSFSIFIYLFIHFLLVFVLLLKCLRIFWFFYNRFKYSACVLTFIAETASA